MGIAEKIANAKRTDWVSEGFSETEIKTFTELAKISARIERCRIDMHMTQQEFAQWESREYNFTIKTLNEICQKIDLELYVSLEKTCMNSEYTIVKWDSENIIKKREKSNWVVLTSNKEAIA